MLILQLPQNQKGPVGAYPPVIGETGTGELGKFLHFPHLHREQVVDTAGELGALRHLGATAHLPFKSSHVVAAGSDESDLDVRLDGEADSLGIEQRRVGPNDPGLLQPPHPAHAGRSRYTQLLRKVSQGSAVVFLEQPQKPPIGGIEGCWAHGAM